MSMGTRMACTRSGAEAKGVIIGAHGAGPWAAIREAFRRCEWDQGPTRQDTPAGSSPTGGSHAEVGEGGHHTSRSSLGLDQPVGCQHNRAASFDDVQDEVPQEATCLGVHACCGLILPGRKQTPHELALTSPPITQPPHLAGVFLSFLQQLVPMLVTVRFPHKTL